MKIFALICSVLAYDIDKFAANGGFGDKSPSDGQDSVDDLGVINFQEYFDLSKCEILSKCKPCSFKELQKWPECQQTGFRLIKKCKSHSFATGNEEEGSSNMVCFEETEHLKK